MADEIDRARAASAQPYSASYLCTGDEPLIVDLFQPSGAAITKHWIVWGVSFLATLTLRQPDTRGGPPNSGLFMCPPDTPRETLTQAQNGIAMLARPFALPLNDPYLNIATVGAVPTYTMQMLTAVGYQFVLPQGWFLRAIVNCQQGSTTPGPGLNSNGLLTALVSVEDNQDLSGCL